MSPAEQYAPGVSDIMDRAAGFSGQFTPLEEGVRRYVQDHLTQPDLFV